MTWVRVDDHFDEHPKFARAGPLGIALWLVGLAYCNRNLTDGFIPWAKAQSLLTWQFLGEPDENGLRKLFTIGVTCGMSGDDINCNYVIPLLLNAGLWEEIDGGFHVHDYDQYQPLKAQILADREAAKERMRDVRTNKGRTSPKPHPKRRRSSVNPTPIPTPIPDPVTTPKPEPDENGRQQ